MSTPAPKTAFDSDEEYYKAFWQMSEYGVNDDEVDFFRYFFSNGYCPKTNEEKKHWDNLPQRVTVYRGFCDTTGTVDKLSWTPDKKLATWFAKRHPNVKPVLAIGEIDKENIVTVIIGREVEYIICSICNFDEDAITYEDV